VRSTVLPSQVTRYSGSYRSGTGVSPGRSACKVRLAIAAISGRRHLRPAGKRREAMRSG